MRLLLAFLFLFYAAFDECLIETMSHQTQSVASEAYAEQGDCESEDMSSSENAECSMCHTCESCHNWLEYVAQLSNPPTVSPSYGNYLFQLPYPDVQKIERPPINS